MDVQPGGIDPAEKDLIAHTTARLLVDGARTTDDEQTLQRLITLTDTHGLDTLAQMWSGTGADTLPGTLWRLYVLRDWVHRDPRTAAREFDAGRRCTPVLEAVAGVAEPPGPDEVRTLVDSVLAGAYTGDFGVALERAAAFSRIVAVGRAKGDDEDPQSTESAVKLIKMAEHLEFAAGAWRRHELH
jgi:hypothetical protein